MVTTDIDASLNYVGFQGDFSFDSSVVTFASPPSQKAGLTSGNWNVAANVLAGGGPIRTLRISAFSNDFTALSGQGTLFELRMLRVSGTPGAASPLVWAAPPNTFFFIDADMVIRTPTQTNGLITIQGPINISGTISYCPNPVPGPVPSVTLTLTGSGSGSTLSDSSGNYIFSSLAGGGSYTVTPTKTALAPGSAGINTTDVIAVKQHFLNIALLTGCRLTAADVNGDNTVNTVDVIAIQRFFLGLSTGIANVGKYQFIPANRSYPGLVSDQTGQNYDTLIFGDVASHFAE